MLLCFILFHPIHCEYYQLYRIHLPKTRNILSHNGQLLNPLPQTILIAISYLKYYGETSTIIAYSCTTGGMWRLPWWDYPQGVQLTQVLRRPMSYILKNADRLGEHNTCRSGGFYLLSAIKAEMRKEYEDAIIGTRIEEQQLSRQRNCHWQITGRYKSRNCIFYHGQKFKQP